MTVNGGTVVAKGGDAQAGSFGILGYKMTATGGTVLATGGTVLATGGTAVQISCGIYVDRGDEDEYGYGPNGGRIDISGKANIIATGGDALASFGIHAQFALNINGGHVTARTLAEGNTQRGALDRNPALSFTDTYWWRTSAEASYTEGNFVWNDDPYDTYVEITDHFTITFDTDGGTAIAPIMQDYGKTVTAPADPTKEGYTFAKWDPAIPATMPAKDITIKAIWTINQYTITFATDDGIEIASITQDYNTAVTAPENPTKEGYTFAGWDKEIPSTMPAENITVKAQWTVNQYTITFDTDGGSEIASITKDYGAAVTAPEAPTKAGYTFAGWDKEIPSTMPAENITVKAQWTKNSTGSSSSGGGFSGTYNYPVRVDSTSSGAAVTLNKTNAVAGDKVTITVTPDAGKAVDEVIVTDADGKAIAVTKTGDNQYTFTMPAGNVNIAVTTKAADYQNKIVMQIGNRNILENNKTITNDVAPIIVDNRTMVPIRVITEILGGTAHWNAGTQTVTLNIDGRILTMTIGQTISGFDTAPIIRNDRTYVPVRYVAEKLGASVEWVGTMQQIIITK